LSKTKKMMSGVVATLMAVSVAGCGNEEGLPPVPDADCDDWEWDSETGTWYCDDEYSSHHGMYYFGKRFYKSKSLLKQANGFNSHLNSYKSGIGSGTKGSFGG
jgi:uncharacterized lipoprotein YehR (DUF1307 family)